MKDLFGNEYTEMDLVREQISSVGKGKFQIAFEVAGYRRSEGDERCKNCRYRVTHQYSKTYHKCEWIGDTRSTATDIRLRNVCNRWRLKEV